MDNLCLEDIVRLIPDELASLFDIDLYQCVASTNEVIKECMWPAHAHYKVVAALEQNAGKGRRGKSFYSPKDSGIYLSIACDAKTIGQGFEGLTAKAALAVCAAIKDCIDLDPKIKWVNDVYVDGKKVCGILCETKTGMHDNESGAVIIGIGINVYQPSSLPSSLETKIGFLSNTQIPGLRNRLVAALLAHIHIELRDSSQTFIKRYKELSFLDGREILIKTEKGSNQKAQVLGIDDALRLRVRYLNGQVGTLTSLDVSIEVLA